MFSQLSRHELVMMSISSDFGLFTVTATKHENKTRQKETAGWFHSYNYRDDKHLRRQFYPYDVTFTPTLIAKYSLCDEELGTETKPP